MTFEIGNIHDISAMVDDVSSTCMKKIYSIFYKYILVFARFYFGIWPPILKKKYWAWPRHHVNLFQTSWKCSIDFYLEFYNNVYQWLMLAMKRTTMFREKKPLGHKHILRVDCMNDNQALVMQQRIGIVKIHEILFKICWNRYVTSLEQIRYPIALSFWTKGI